MCRSVAGLDDIASDVFDFVSVSSERVFVVQSNKLVLGSPLDYERRESYLLNVSVVDRLGPTGFTVSITATVVIGDVNDITGTVVFVVSRECACVFCNACNVLSCSRSHLISGCAPCLCAMWTT